MLPLFLLFLMTDPTPTGKWQVPIYPVEHAQLNQRGDLFLVSGREVFHYDLDGTLKASHSVDFDITYLTTDRSDQFWFVDARGILRCFDRYMLLQWQRRIGTDGLITLPLETNMGLITKRLFQVINSGNGNTPQAVLLPQTIAYAHANRGIMYFATHGGANYSWNGQQTITPLLARFQGQPLTFISENHQGMKAMVFDKTTLMMVKPDWNIAWQRSYNLDISQAPLWFADDRLLAIVSQGRSIYVYRPNGHEKKRFHLRDRPTGIHRYGAHAFLVTQTEEPEIVWFDGAEQRFSTTALSSHVTHVTKNSQTLLLIAYDGQLLRFDSPDRAEPTN